MIIFNFKLHTFLHIKEKFNQLFKLQYRILKNDQNMMYYFIYTLSKCLNVLIKGAVAVKIISPI